MQIDDFKKFLKENGSLKIAILDNNSIEFLRNLTQILSPDKILGRYSLILIPGWVKPEIDDSTLRSQFVRDLSSVYNLNIVFIDEVDYDSLYDFKSGILFDLFLNACAKIAPVISFLHKDILNGSPIMDLDPDEWIPKLYAQGLNSSVILSNGRTKKKNAGEISITVLSFILAYHYYINIENVTIISSDRDAYDYVKNSQEKLGKHPILKDLVCKPITFKSNDFLFYEIKQSQLLNLNTLSTVIGGNRNDRRIKFTRRIKDGSIEEINSVLSNIEFGLLLNDDTIHIIF